MIFKIFYKWKYHTFILVVLCKTKCTKVRKPIYMVAESAQISLHLKCRRPSLKCEHGLPVQPEISLPEGVRQNLTYLLVFKLLLRCHKQLGKCHLRLLIKCKFFICVCILSTFFRGSAKRVVRVVFI